MKEEFKRKKKEYNEMRYKIRFEVKQKILDSKKKKIQKFEMYDFVLENFRMKRNQGLSYICVCCL